ncbi:hypothetical protein [Spongiactinospora sp. TRM90649]|uniref:hypothetical protein n=1 Tax=Spongiactinospora sp. TRM90649 TaxID=3031114 RepID=UPI0023F8A7A7|nr:hypothetical protein [Spongiactinospora sp. TRM90649]MDF5756240.1 hypothetical protein [Spongiactinospora sp. TRM90649]
MPFFIRSVESRLLPVLRKHRDSPIEALVAHSGLSPEEVRKSLSTLRRRGLVAETGEGRYSLTDIGVKTSLHAAPDDTRDRSSGVFLLDDEIEEAASSASEAELNSALDDALGTPEREPAPEPSADPSADPRAEPER